MLKLPQSQEEKKVAHFDKRHVFPMEHTDPFLQDTNTTAALFKTAPSSLTSIM